MPKQGLSSVGYAFDLRNFLEGNINHQTKHDAKHQTSNMERSYKTLFQVAFIFTKVIHRRRLTGPLIRP